MAWASAPTSVKPQSAESITAVDAEFMAMPRRPPTVGSPWMKQRSKIRSWGRAAARSEEHTSELQSLAYLVCRLLLEKKKINQLHKISRYMFQLLDAVIALLMGVMHWGSRTSWDATGLISGLTCIVTI